MQTVDAGTPHYPRTHRAHTRTPHQTTTQPHASTAHTQPACMYTFDTVTHEADDRNSMGDMATAHNMGEMAAHAMGEMAAACYE